LIPKKVTASCKIEPPVLMHILCNVLPVVANAFTREMVIWFRKGLRTPDAALPPDARKASGLPATLIDLFEAAPRYGHSPEVD